MIWYKTHITRRMMKNFINIFIALFFSALGLNAQVEKRIDAILGAETTAEMKLSNPGQYRSCVILLSEGIKVMELPQEKMPPLSSWSQINFRDKSNPSKANVQKAQSEILENKDMVLKYNFIQKDQTQYFRLDDNHVLEIQARRRNSHVKPNRKS